MPLIPAKFAVHEGKLAVDVRHRVGDILAIAALCCRVVEMYHAIAGVEVALAAVGECEELLAQCVGDDIAL